MYEILSSIREKYYDEIPEFGNSYRNLVMHANRFLLLEKDDMFEELLTDYINDHDKTANLELIQTILRELNDKGRA